MGGGRKAEGEQREGVSRGIGLHARNGAYQSSGTGCKYCAYSILRSPFLLPIFFGRASRKGPICPTKGRALEASSSRRLPAGSEILSSDSPN